MERYSQIWPVCFFLLKSPHQQWASGAKNSFQSAISLMILGKFFCQRNWVIFSIHLSIVWILLISPLWYHLTCSYPCIPCSSLVISRDFMRFKFNFWEEKGRDQFVDGAVCSLQEMHGVWYLLFSWCCQFLPKYIVSLGVTNYNANGTEILL